MTSLLLTRIVISMRYLTKEQEMTVHFSCQARQFAFMFELMAKAETLMERIKEQLGCDQNLRLLIQNNRTEIEYLLKTDPFNNFLNGLSSEDRQVFDRIWSDLQPSEPLFHTQEQNGA